MKKQYINSDRAVKMAITIIEQLGGQSFIEKSGAYNLCPLLDEWGGVSFRIPETQSGINSVSIVLQFSDTYNVYWERTSEDGIEVLETETDVYAFNLTDTFQKHTGTELEKVKFGGPIIMALDNNLKPIPGTEKQIEIQE